MIQHWSYAVTAPHLHEGVVYPSQSLLVPFHFLRHLRDAHARMYDKQQNNLQHNGDFGATTAFTMEETAESRAASQGAAAAAARSTRSGASSSVAYRGEADLVR